MSENQYLVSFIEKNLEDAILKKEYLPDQRLPSENKLCEQFGVSRTSVREAIKALSSRGLVRIRKGSGIYVNTYSSDHAVEQIDLYFRLNFNRDTLIDLMKTRQIFEPQVAALCAEFRTSKEIEILENNLERFKNRDQKPAALAKLDVEFHSTIAKGCGNPILSLILQPLFNQLPHIKALIVKNVQNKKDTAFDFHERIYQAIVANDTNEAAQAMKAHMEIAMNDALQLADTIFNPAL